MRKENKNGSYGSSPLRVRIKLEDFDEDGVIHRYLTTNPEFVTIIFRPYYLFTLTDTSSVSGTLSTEAVKQAFEKIFGEGSRQSSYLVDRKVAQALKEELAESVEIVFDRIDPDGHYTDIAVDYVLDFMSNLERLELSELEDATENLFIYGIGEAKKEITPDEYRNLTTSYKESTKVMESLKKTWDNLVDFASNSRSVEEFHRESRSYLDQSFDTYIKGKVKFAFVKVRPNAGTKWHLEKRTEDLEDSEKEEVREVQQTISNSGSYEEELFNEAYKEWTGEDYSAGVNVKHLNIHKVSRVDISKELKAKVTIIDAVGEEAIRGPEIQFGISDEDTVGKKVSKKLRENGNSLVVLAVAKVWQQHGNEIMQRAIQVRRPPAIIHSEFSSHFSGILWGYLAKIISSCASGEELNLPSQMPTYAYYLPKWFRSGFIQMKNHHGLSGSEADVANAYFNQLINFSST